MEHQYQALFKIQFVQMFVLVLTRVKFVNLLSINLIVCQLILA